MGSSDSFNLSLSFRSDNCKNMNKFSYFETNELFCICVVLQHSTWPVTLHIEYQ